MPDMESELTEYIIYKKTKCNQTHDEKSLFACRECMDRGFIYEEVNLLDALKKIRIRSGPDNDLPWLCKGEPYIENKV
mgnify:CR=1 FL=1